MAKRTDSRKTAKKQQRPINGETLHAAVTWAAQEKIFAQVRWHGNTSWQAVDLVVLAVVWVWSNAPTLTGAFAEARCWSMQVLGRVAVSTYQGLLKALVRWTAELLPLLRRRLHALMEEHGGKHWRVGEWLALAVDGSRVSVPRTRENEKAFCAPNFGRGKTAKYRKKKRKGARRRTKAPQSVKPQVWLTLLWHMGLEMPWNWQTGPSHASEREHFRQLLATKEFPENTLFCGDAGFTGYDLWRTILDGGHSFLIRVGANVRLLKKLGVVRERADTVYFWPDKAARRKQPPLVLRLLRVRVGRCSMCLVTNVLDEKRLSAAEAARLYQLRWGVELQFRTVKQTFGRRTLRSRTPKRALVELDWSLLGLWMIQLFAVKEQIEIGEVPEHCSVALAIHIVRETMQRWWERPEEAFSSRLQGATKDRYQRRSSKKARYQPQYKDKPSTGEPIIVTANRKHKAMLEAYFSTAA